MFFFVRRLPLALLSLPPLSVCRLLPALVGSSTLRDVGSAFPCRWLRVGHTAVVAEGQEAQLCVRRFVESAGTNTGSVLVRRLLLPRAHLHRTLQSADVNLTQQLLAFSITRETLLTRPAASHSLHRSTHRSPQPPSPWLHLKQCTSARHCEVCTQGYMITQCGRRCLINYVSSSLSVVMGRRSRASITFLCRSSQELPIYLRCGDKLKVIEHPWLLSRSVSRTRLQHNIAKTFDALFFTWFYK